MPPTPRLNATYWHPPFDASTYRDLLLFEERLKTNAASLQSRKWRYQLFLTALLLVIALLSSEILLSPSYDSLCLPFAISNTIPTLHRYLAEALLFVSVTTLVLFFASGMYQEKIEYANQYVPHANRALRSFNMYLNVRKPPLRSKLPSFLNPLSFLFPFRPTTIHSPSPSSTPTLHPPSPSPTPQPPTPPHDPSSPVTQTLPASPTPTPLPLYPIPPSTLPHGELIFSSRIPPPFRDSYERYRATFERRRDERERAAWAKTWLGWCLFKVFRIGGITERQSGERTSGERGPGDTPSATPSPRHSLRGRRGTPVPTPTGSRRASPVPASGNARGGSRSGTPSDRERSESLRRGGYNLRDREHRRSLQIIL